MAKAWVSIHCDATSRGNPGPSAWGAVLTWGKTSKEFFGPLGIMTSNKAELMAVLKSLQQLTRTNLSITIYTDSQYVAFGFIGKWKIKTHVELWQQIFRIREKHKEIILSWIPREHQAHADRLAKKGLRI